MNFDNNKSSASKSAGASSNASKNRNIPEAVDYSFLLSEASAEGERLQKVLAAAGVASRRVCEDYIVQGRVKVNGKTVTELGTRINPEVDLVSVDGIGIQLDNSKRYLLLNKPAGVVSSLKDEQGRPDLSIYTRDFTERVYHVGRLDSETTGLLLLTNDGELAHVLSHPSFGIKKTYVARVRGRANSSTIKELLDGVELEDGFIKADKARLLSKQQQGGQSLIELTIHSGKNRIVRRFLAALGFPVIELARVAFGSIRLGSLPVGKVRDLNSAELGDLLNLVRAAAEQKNKNN